jgi:uncharacterized protein with FMN-binding domain
MKKHPIRHILLSTAATVSGVVLLLALKSPGLPGTSTEARAPVAEVTAPAPVPPASAPSDPQAPEEQQNPGTPQESEEPREPAQPPDTPKAPKAPKAPSREAAAARTVTGDAVQTDYGPVQVRITLSGGRITAATAVQAPSSTPRSQEITSSAVPRLDRAAVSAQSAEIDAVSGATYTSEGYIGSLQSALDKAGV